MTAFAVAASVISNLHSKLNLVRLGINSDVSKSIMAANSGLFDSLREKLTNGSIKKPFLKRSRDGVIALGNTVSVMLFSNAVKATCLSKAPTLRSITPMSAIVYLLGCMDLTSPYAEDILNVLTRLSV